MLMLLSIIGSFDFVPQKTLSAPPGQDPLTDAQSDAFKMLPHASKEVPIYNSPPVHLDSEILRCKKIATFLTRLNDAIKNGEYLTFFFILLKLKNFPVPKEKAADLLYHTIRNWGHPTALKTLIESRKITREVLEIVKERVTQEWNLQWLKAQEQTALLSRGHVTLLNEKEPVSTKAENSAVHVIEFLLHSKDLKDLDNPQFVQWLYEASNMHHEASVIRLANDDTLDFIRDQALCHMYTHAARTGNELFLTKIDRKRSTTSQ